MLQATYSLLQISVFEIVATHKPQARILQPTPLTKTNVRVPVNLPLTRSNRIPQVCAKFEGQYVRANISSGHAATWGN
jgi:hypothetical protein